MDLRPKPADAVLTGAPGPAAQPGSLTGIRVIEMADEQAEYCGLTLAGLGADVLKVEPPGGNPTRRIGPFYRDKPDPEGSLFFWQYNRGKRSVVFDLDREADQERLRSLLACGLYWVLLSISTDGTQSARGAETRTLIGSCFSASWTVTPRRGGNPGFPGMAVRG